MAFNKLTALWKSALIVGMALVGVLYLGSYVYSSSFAGDDSQAGCCLLNKNKSSFSRMVSTISTLTVAQESDQRCENKKHPSGKKPDPNKIDCECKPKCVDGKRQEDRDCKKHCKPDTCDCRDPCPKT